MPEETVEKKALASIDAWVHRCINVASDRWTEVEKKFGRGSQEERRASGHLHDLIGVCMNIRSWAQQPESALLPWATELRETYHPDNKVGGPAKVLDTPIEQRNLFREMLVTMVEKGEGCILGEGRSLGPGCCRYCEAKALLEKYP